MLPEIQHVGPSPISTISSIPAGGVKGGALTAQGRRSGRCKVRRRAERVSRPAIEKNRRRRVLVVISCSPRPTRAVQRARLCAITWTANQAALAAKRQALRDLRSLGILENPRVGGFT